MHPADRPGWAEVRDGARCIAAASGVPAAMVAVVRAAALRTGWPVERAGLRLLANADDDTASGERRLDPVPADMAVPELFGAVHEALVEPEGRRAAGVHYTPSGVAGPLVAIALDGVADGGESTSNRRRQHSVATVCDPAVGGGAFLLAAARWLHGRGEDPARVVAERLFGADIDPVAVAVAEAALGLWAWTAAGKPVDPPPPGGPNRLALADLLVDGEDAWPDRPAAGFDAVVGNPPFLNQLGRATARSVADRRRLQDRWGPAVQGYVDTGAVFLLAGCQLARPGGRVALLQPESVLGADHAEPLRVAVLARAALDGLWIGRDQHFPAGVRVCAPVLTVRPGEPASVVSRWVGAGFEPLPPAQLRESGGGGGDSLSWAHLAASAYATPQVDLRSAGTLADLVVGATAGFRDQFYGLAPHVRDHPVPGGGESTSIRRETSEDPKKEFPPLVTVGLIDPLACRWGDRWVRFAGRRWRRPVVDRASLAATDPRLARWVGDRLVPKVLVATQTRVVEAVIDGRGEMVPSVPVVAVAAPVDQLAMVAAVLHAPPVSAWALHRAGGTALAGDAIKLSARQVLEIPLPEDETRWRRAANILAGHDAGPGPVPDPSAFGAEMCAAYGLDPGHPVLAWWLGRLTSWASQPAVTRLP